MDMEEPERKSAGGSGSGNIRYDSKAPRKVRFKLNSSYSGRVLKHVYEDGQELERPEGEKYPHSFMHTKIPRHLDLGQLYSFSPDLPSSEQPSTLYAQRINVYRNVTGLRPPDYGDLPEGGDPNDPVLDFGKIIIYTSNLRIIPAPHKRKERERDGEKEREERERERESEARGVTQDQGGGEEIAAERGGGGGGGEGGGRGGEGEERRREGGEGGGGERGGRKEGGGREGVRGGGKEGKDGRRERSRGGSQESSKGHGHRSRSKHRSKSGHGKRELTPGKHKQQQDPGGGGGGGGCLQCGGSGCAPCSLCHGSKLSMLAIRFNESIRDLRCQACYPGGLEPCQSCAK